MTHDFKKFPELTNNQMQIYYWESPHKQIMESFEGEVVKIVDGDTIHVDWIEREKPIRIRLLGIAAAELGEEGGEKSRSWLERQIMGKFVQVIIDPKQRVGKWGRILGRIMHGGIDINQESINQNFSVDFRFRKANEIPSINTMLGGRK